jgi:cholesterol transport system auxiliary component
VRAVAAGPILAAFLANGCALLSRGASLKPRYYDPNQPARAATIAGEPTCALHLGDVSASDDLGQSIAFRTSAYEVGYYETRRWSQSPDNYLRRALVHALFDERRCRRVLSGDGPTLDVQLLNFEQQLGPDRARVAVHMMISDTRGVRVEQTFEANRPFGGGAGGAAFDAFVAAISVALDDVVAQVVQAATSAATTGPALPDER